jgi:23S rRNA pseudouridine1911/1915/1917 synthase
MQYTVNEKITIFSFLEKIGYKNKIIKQYLKNKEVIVNGNVQVKYNYLLKENDIITLIKRLDNGIIILYEDKDIIVVFKPYHMLSVADLNNKNNTLYYKLSEYVKAKNKKAKIFIVHRIDYDTAGIMVFAKSKEAKETLQKNWQHTKREYYALVHGNVKDKETLKFYLKENGKMLVYVTKKDNYAKEAITHYEKISVKNNISLVTITIETGRKNQIRVSFKEIGHPILGDLKYGKKDDYNHLYLYASKLGFTHPSNGNIMEFTLPLLDDFKKLV